MRIKAKDLKRFFEPSVVVTELPSGGKIISTPACTIDLGQVRCLGNGTIEQQITIYSHLSEACLAAIQDVGGRRWL